MLSNVPSIAEWQRVTSNFDSELSREAVLCGVCSSACQADCAGFAALSITAVIFLRASARRPNGRLHTEQGRRGTTAGCMPRA